MFIYFLVYLIFMVSIYALVPLLGGGDVPFDGVVKFYAVLNIVFMFTVVWWNARKHFYYVWGLYLIVIAGYYGFVYPAVRDFPSVIVFGIAGLNILTTFYDVVICRCKGIYRRTRKRYEVPIKK